MHKYNMGKKYQALWLLQENTFFCSVLLTKLNTLLHQKHSSKFQNGKSLYVILRKGKLYEAISNLLSILSQAIGKGFHGMFTMSHLY